MESKAFYLSKTFWTNLIMGVVAVAIPQVKEVLTPEVISSIFVVVNIILRFVSSKQITLK